VKGKKYDLVGGQHERNYKCIMLIEENMKENDHWKDIGINGRIIFKGFLELGCRYFDVFNLVHGRDQ
jgi:hypothetical protein